MLLNDDRVDIVDLPSPSFLNMQSGICGRILVWPKLVVYELFEQKPLPPLRFVRTPRSFRPGRIHKYYY